MAFVAFWGCAPAPTPSEAIWGPTMPIRAGASETALLLQDWLMPGQNVGAVVYHPEPGVKLDLEVNDGGAALPSPPSSGLGHIAIQSGARSLHVPVLGKGERAMQAVFVPMEDQLPHHVQFVGDATGWTPQDAKLQEDGRWTYDLVLLPGSHPYQWVVDGEWQLDAHNAITMSNGMGGQNSALVVDAPVAPALSAQGQGSKVFLSTDGPATLLVMIDNDVVHFGDHDDAVVLPLSLEEDAVGRRHLRAWAAHDGGISQDLLLPIEGNEVVTEVGQLNRSDWHAATMYFLMVDRFVDGEPSNNEPVENAAIRHEANHQGGDLQGVEQRLRSGYFQDLGLNTVWISPVTQNAEGAWGLWQDSARTEVTSKFSGYHGYWPVSCTQVDRRFGAQGALEALTESAHEQEMNVVLDYVANHVHEDHPLMDAHPDWTTDLYLPDGTMNTEKVGRAQAHHVVRHVHAHAGPGAGRGQRGDERQRRVVGPPQRHRWVPSRRDQTHPGIVLEKAHPQTEKGPTAEREADVPDWRDVRQSRPHRKLPLFRHDRRPVRLQPLRQDGGGDRV